LIGRLRHLLVDGGLAARALRSTFFSVAGFGGENVLRLAGNLVLTRLLFPEAFGLMALVTVVMNGLGMLSDIGLRSSIIQNERGSDPAFLNTAWTLQIARGLLLFAATWALAGPVASFYGDPRLEDMLKVAALVPLVVGFVSTRLSTASRDLQIGRMTCLSLATQVAGLIVTIALAYWLRSVWALVIGGLVAPTLLVIFSHIVLPGNRDRIAFEPEAAWQLMSFGMFIFVASIAGFIVNQGDRAILGKFVSLEDLALYNIGFFLATVPLMLNGKIVDGVIFPLYSRRPPSESEENRRKIMKARRLMTGFAVTIALFFGAIGNWLVILLYDIRYEGAGPLMVLIAVAQLPIIISATYSSLAMAAGDSGRFAVIVIFDALIRMSVTLAATANFGVVGAALAPLPAGLLYYPVLIAMTRRYRAWDPMHDLFFFAASMTCASGVIWLNWDAVGPLLARLSLGAG
jgi:O-antigen/teichoic acid export membrane protein